MARSAIASTKQQCLALPELFGAIPLDEVAELAALVCQTPYAMAVVWHPLWGELRGAHGISWSLRIPFSRIEATGRGVANGPLRGNTDLQYLAQVPVQARGLMSCFSGIPLKTRDDEVLGALWVFHGGDHALSMEQWRGLVLLSRQFTAAVGSAGTEVKRSESIGEDMHAALALGFHDLKSPLSTVALEVGALFGRGGVSNGTAPRLARILSAVDRMHGIIHRLIDKTEDFSLRLAERKTKKNQT